MASTYVNDLRLEEIGTGDQSGTWGATTNTNLELIAEAFSFGTEAITTNADTHTTTIADGSTDPGRSMYLKYTGTLDSACTITIGPNTVSKMWFIENGTSGSQNIIISQGSGANITIPPGDVKVVYSDGAGSGAAVVDAFASLSVVDLKVQDDLTVTDDMTVGGTLGVTGIVTLTDDLIIGDGKTIGSASDVDAMTIASNGQVTFTQTLIGTALDISGDIDVDGTTNLDVVDIDGALTQDGGAVFNEASADVDFRVESNGNANMLFVDAGNNRVGIGTGSPSNNLEIFTDSGDEGLTIKATGDTSNAIISDANRSGAGAAINALTGKWNGTSVADILFLTGADTTNKDDGVITFRTSSADNLTQRMKIHASGCIDLGADVDRSLGTNITTTVTSGSAGSGFWLSTGNSSATSSKIFTTVNGSVGELFINQGSGVNGGSTIFKINDTQQFRINSNGTAVVRTGILFGSDSAAANQLDDYEEGTWTPTFSGATLSQAVGTYTKIGNIVTVSYRIVTTGGLPSSGTQVQVGGLPFTISNATINGVASGFGGVGSVYVGPSNVSSATGGGGTIVSFASGNEAFLRYVNVDTTTLGYTLMGELEVSANNAITAFGTQTYQV